MKIKNFNVLHAGRKSRSPRLTAVACQESAKEANLEAQSKITRPTRKKNRPLPRSPTARCEGSRKLRRKKKGKLIPGRFDIATPRARKTSRKWAVDRHHRRNCVCGKLKKTRRKQAKEKDERRKRSRLRAGLNIYERDLGTAPLFADIRARLFVAGVYQGHGQQRKSLIGEGARSRQRQGQTRVVRRASRLAKSNF